MVEIGPTVRGCATEGCAKDAAPGRRVCYACQKRKWRQGNVLTAAWCKIRDRAKERGIPFRLPLAVFLEEAAAVGYDTRKGRRPENLHLDRIDARRGYMVGNLQFLTASENCSKGARERGRVLIIEDNENVPF